MESYNPKAILRQAGFRATIGRVIFLKALYSAGKPLSVQAMLRSLKKNTVDQATAYRIVEALRAKGIVQYVNMEHGHAHFELVSPAHHHHAICEICGKVADISKCNIKHLEDEALKVSGFSRLNRHSLEFFGMCKSCNKKSL